MSRTITPVDICRVNGARTRTHIVHARTHTRPRFENAELSSREATNNRPTNIARLSLRDSRSMRLHDRISRSSRLLGLLRVASV